VLSITNKIVANSLSAASNKISQPKVAGVLRSYESPNTEKNIIIVQDQEQKYWIVVSITNIGEVDSIDPIVEDVRNVEPDVAVGIISKGS
jgi:hypothetical protein